MKIITSKVFKYASDGINKLNDKAVNSMSEHLTGNNHSTHHKFITGCVVMFIGVLFSKLGAGPLHVVTEVIGFSLHAIGVIPFADIISKSWIERNNKNINSKD